MFSFSVHDYTMEGMLLFSFLLLLHFYGWGKGDTEEVKCDHTQQWVAGLGFEAGFLTHCAMYSLQSQRELGAFKCLRDRSCYWGEIEKKKERKWKIEGETQNMSKIQTCIWGGTLSMIIAGEAWGLSREVVNL